jgi:hypothetical protein
MSGQVEKKKNRNKPRILTENKQDCKEDTNVGIFDNVTYLSH